ncbi:unnamed protein product [Arctia plantaginis]|uniref:Uncharacterized protein n=1 Tax=Arctia plantaginis TaxID=874455 RepID=A0A8S0YPX2_ARCPL|nr:unnamed protein product [Arctia plantaginis]CAB3235557.1 unnamed protein product [Arctia plantaginis]
MANNTSVGDFGPYRFVCLFFGYHSGPKLDKWRIVHTLTLVILISSCIYLTEPPALTMGVCVEYMLYITISMKLRDRHLHQFYRPIPAIDSLPHAKAIYSNIRKHQIIALCVWMAYRSVSAVIVIGQSIVTVEFWSKTNFAHILMTVIFLCTTTYRLQLLIFVVISLLKVVSFVFLPLLMIFRLTMPYVPFICSVVLLDLVRDELERINMLTIQAYIQCKNERWRSEIQQLRQVLVSHPLQYTLWRIVPLSLYPVLTTLSFWIVTSMGIVQISFH